MCITSSSQQNTQPINLNKIDEMIWLQNVIKTRAIKSPSSSATHQTRENEITESKIWEGLAGLSKYLLFDHFGPNRDLDGSRLQIRSSDEEKEDTSAIHPDTSYGVDQEHELEILREELLQTKRELQYSISLYRSYIKELSCYILYTNMMIVLFYLMILAILFSYPSCLYLYLFTPLRYL